jgi:sRNA-binding carbon storage regulator CsrA
MSLKLGRKSQQTIVLKPNKATTEPMVIRVLEVLPNAVGLGFDGDDYAVIRGEIYEEREDTHERYKVTK